MWNNTMTKILKKIWETWQEANKIEMNRKNWIKFIND